MERKICMIYKDVLEKRLQRKREQLLDLEGKINSEGVVTFVAISFQKSIMAADAVVWH